MAAHGCGVIFTGWCRREPGPKTKQGRDMFNHWLSRYGWIATGLLLPAVGAALQSLYWSHYPVAPFLFFIPAVFFSAQLGGRRGGMLAVLLSIFLAKYLFFEPVHTLSFASPAQAGLLLFGVAISLIIVQFHHNLQSRTLQLKVEQERTREALRRVEQREEELGELNADLERKVAERTSELLANQADLERIRANLEASEVKFRAVFEQSPLGLALGDAATSSLIVVNNRFLEITGLSHEEYVQQHWAEYTHPDDLPAELDLLERLQKGEISGYEIDKRFLRPDGSSVWIHLSISPVLIDAVRGRWDLAIVEDITSRKQLQERLEISETRHRLLAEYAADTVWTMNLDGKITYISPAVEKARGFTVEEAMRQSLDEILTPASQTEVVEYFQRLHAAVQANQPAEGYRGEQEYLCKDGSTFWGDVIVRPHYAPDGRFIELVGVTRNISERKRAELEMIKLTAELRQTNATRDKLFSIIAHDLRGSIGGLQQGLELVTERAMLDEARKAMLLEELKKSSRLTFSLVENLLNWARSQTNSISIEPKVFNLAEPVREVIETLRPMANQKRITLEWEGEAAVPVLADKSSIEVVLRNLLSNAIKFTPEHGRVSLSAVESDGRVEVTVADSGVGMSREVLARLFQPDSYFSTYGTAREKGSGIGLMLCKDFIERNGGLLQAESEEGRGSRFIFTLPRG